MGRGTCWCRYVSLSNPEFVESEFSYLFQMRIFRETKKRLVDLVGKERLDAHEYEGLGHVASGAEFREMCVFLEKILLG